MIKTVGKILWERKDQRQKKSTMGEMRKLGSLLLACQQLSQTDALMGHEMLDPVNLRIVTDAIKNITQKEDSLVRSSLKLSLGYLLKKAASYTKSEFAIDVYYIHCTVIKRHYASCLGFQLGKGCSPVSRLFTRIEMNKHRIF